jgi:hypothetical protein
VLSEAELDLVARYLSYCAPNASSSQREGRPDPYFELNDYIFRGSSKAWHLVLEILRCASDDDLGYYAAGPLEDLVREQGALFVDRIEAEARRDPRFRWALGIVWIPYRALPEPVLDRIIAASDNEMLVLGAPPGNPKGRVAKPNPQPR